MRIAYLLSMRRGISRFFMREIAALHRQGVTADIFPVPKGKGLYMPEAGWWRYDYKLWRIIGQNLDFALQHPLRFLSLLGEAVRYGCIKEFVLAVDFSFAMRQREIQKIHCQFADYKLYTGYFCKKILGLPLSVNVHSYELYRNPNWKMFRPALNACDRIFVTSNYSKNLLATKFGIPESKISVMYLFVEQPPERELIKILVVARLVEVKGHKYLFQALKQLNRQDIVLWIVGTGELHSQLQAMVNQLELQDRVHFFGEMKDRALDSLFESCDILCLPSVITQDGYQEGFGVVLMEAMAYAKPVIATDCGGAKELVEETLIPPADINALAQAIAKLADDKELRLKQGLRNRQIIQARFSEKNIEILCAYYVSPAPIPR